MPAFVIQLNIFWNSIIFKEKKVSFFTIIKCYSNRCVQNADCRLHTGGVGLSFLDRLIFLHSWWESKETFLGVASVISRPSTCLVSIAGRHFCVCVNGSRAKLKTFVYRTRLTFDSIFYSGTITCFVYPSANRTLLLQERTGHLWAQPVETHLNPNCFSSSLSFCFDRHFEFSRASPLYTWSQTPVPGSRFPVPRSPFPVPRSPFPVPRISNIRKKTFYSWKQSEGPFIVATNVKFLENERCIHNEVGTSTEVLPCYAQKVSIHLHLRQLASLSKAGLISITIMLTFRLLQVGVANGKCETLRDGETSVFLCKPEIFWLLRCETETSKCFETPGHLRIKNETARRT